jgi:hypothetical protein
MLPRCASTLDMAFRRKVYDEMGLVMLEVRRRCRCQPRRGRNEDGQALAGSRPGSRHR